VTFQEYLTGKKINPDAFRQHDTERFKEWEREFEQMHPNSFTIQKLHLINTIRRKYLITSTEKK
jgi:hypothetical protein